MPPLFPRAGLARFVLPLRQITIRGAQTSSFRIRPSISRLPVSRPQVRYQHFQYQRFDQGGGGNPFRRWVMHPNFLYHVAGIAAFGGAVYVYNLEVVPVSGRRRFNIVSTRTEEAMAQEMYSQVIAQFRHQILPEWDKRTRLVKRVLKRLIPASGLTNANWEVFVIDSDEKNAFVIPGGKVFVFSGILPTCGTEDGLAAVLGHEIAHNVAHHAAERVSSALILSFIPVILAAFGIEIPDAFSNLVLELAFMRPGSRKQETEADYIGLMMMAQSCYDPEAAVGLWERMEKAEEYAPPQFLSTHPSSHNRQGKIREWLPEARNKREMSDCHSVLDYADDFRRAYRQAAW